MFNTEKLNTQKFLNGLLVVVFAVGAIYMYYARIDRIMTTNIKGGDFKVFTDAASSFIDGTSPYADAIESFSDLDTDPNSKGYAYPSGYLYMYSILYTAENIFLYTFDLEVPAYAIYALPFFIFHFLITIFIYKFLKNEALYIRLFACTLWLFNPYFLTKGDFENRDLVPIFLSLVAFYYLKKDSVITGALLAGSMLFKIYPVILVPLFLFEVKNKKQFVLAGLLTFFAGSLPFLTSFTELKNYILGGFFVHGDRFIQGRPFLWYLRYYYKLDLIEVVPFKIYALLSVTSAWVLTVVLYALKYKNLFFTTVWAFLLFYLFTPVLNRTYILWGLPFFAIAYCGIKKPRLKIVYTIILFLGWLFLYWYLDIWNDGFDIWHPSIY